MILLLFLLVSPVEEVRFCGPPLRDDQGQIVRSYNVRAAFKRLYPCPSTGKTYGTCPGWVMDHIIPLACGGCDSVSNLQWLPTDVWRDKSLWERKIYGGQSMSLGCP